MSNGIIINDEKIEDVFASIKFLVINSRNRVYAAVNAEMLNLW